MEAASIKVARRLWGVKKTCGADLGPTRAKAAWLTLGVDAKGIVESAPSADFKGTPRLTTQMAAIVQGFQQHGSSLERKRLPTDRWVTRSSASCRGCRRAVRKAILRGLQSQSKSPASKKTISSFSRVPNFCPILPLGKAHGAEGCNKFLPFFLPCVFHAIIQPNSRSSLILFCQSSGTAWLLPRFLANLPVTLSL